MTAAGVLKPPAVPAGTTRRIPVGIRLTWLHLRSRRVPAGVLAFAVCGAVLHAALYWHWTFNSGPYAQQVPMIIEAGAASVIAVTAHSPRCRLERQTPLRLGPAAPDGLLLWLRGGPAPGLGQ